MRDQGLTLMTYVVPKRPVLNFYFFNLFLIEIDRDIF